MSIKIQNIRAQRFLEFGDKNELWAKRRLDSTRLARWLTYFILFTVPGATTALLIKAFAT